jgi:hypothetical protein
VNFSGRRTPRLDQAGWTIKSNTQNLFWKSIDRPVCAARSHPAFYVGVACQPQFLNLLFLNSSKLSHATPRFAHNRGIVSGARSRQGRARFLARRSVPLTARTADRTSGYERNGKYPVAYCVVDRRAFLFMLARLRVRRSVTPPTFYPCPALLEHLMQHARLERLGNQLWGGDPF